MSAVTNDPNALSIKAILGNNFSVQGSNSLANASVGTLVFGILSAGGGVVLIATPGSTTMKVAGGLLLLFGIKGIYDAVKLYSAYQHTKKPVANTYPEAIPAYQGDQNGAHSYYREAIEVCPKGCYTLAMHTWDDTSKSYFYKDAKGITRALVLPQKFDPAVENDAELSQILTYKYIPVR